MRAAGRRHDRRQRRRRPRALGPARSRPTSTRCLYTLTGRVHPEQGWGVAGDTREAIGVVAELGRRRLVHPRRPRHRPAPRAQRAPARGRAALGGHRRPRAPLRARVRAAAGDRRSPAHAHRHGRRGSSVPAVARRPPRERPRARACASRARPARARRPACSRRSPSADRIVLAPSNPFVSLDPILAVDGVRAAVEARRDDVVAITPMIGRRAVKGPLAGDARRRSGTSPRRRCVARVLAPLAPASCSTPPTRQLAPELRALGAAHGLRARR